MGVVSSPERQLTAADPYVYIQTDAPINPGDGGGPLFDTEGRVVGMNAFIISQSGGSEGMASRFRRTWSSGSTRSYGNPGTSFAAGVEWSRVRDSVAGCRTAVAAGLGGILEDVPPEWSDREGRPRARDSWLTSTASQFETCINS